MTDPPTKPDHYDPPSAIFQEPYDLPCPLQGNPQPSCTWSIVNCGQLTPFDPETPVTFKDNNCTLLISVFNTDYAGVCFYCNATNPLGSMTAFINSIQFTREYHSSPL